jgi:tight adherence protein B
LKKSYDNLLKYLFCSVILFLLAAPFSSSMPVKIILSLLLGLAVAKSLNLYSELKIKLEARQQLKSFLEFLCTKISSGNTMETSFLLARNEFPSLYGKKSYISYALEELFYKLDRGESFDYALSKMGKSLPCPEAYSLFETLSKMRHMGSSNLLLIRQSLSMVSDLLMVSKDISGEVSQKRLESTIMSAMPFAVLWSLNAGASDYMDPALGSALGRFVLIIAFSVAVLSFCLGLFIVSRSVYASSGSLGSESRTSLSYYFKKSYKFISSRYPAFNVLMSRLVKILPESYILPQRRTLNYLYPGKDFALTEHIFEKLCIFTAVFFTYFLTSLLADISVIPFALLGMFLIIFHDFEIKNKIETNKNVMMQDLPGFVALIHTLLASGIVLEKAMEMSIKTYYNSTLQLREELDILRSSIGSGIPVSESVEKFADRILVPEISAALILASQYSKSGDIYTLELMKIQTGSCWIQAKVSASRALEQSSVKLLLPMVLQLICVMAITITPAVMSFQMF